MDRNRTLKIFILPVLAVSLILFFTGCNESDSEQTSISENDQVVFEIVEQPEVCGWLDIVLPSSPIAIEGFDSQLWILTTDGLVMNWASDARGWHVLETESVPATSFDIAVSQLGTALLAPEKVTLFFNESVTELELAGTAQPLEICGTDNGFVVLFDDGSLGSVDGTGLESILEPSEKTPTGSLCFDEGTIAWMNADNSLSLFDIEQSLLTELTLPDSSVLIDLANCEILAGTETSVFVLNSSEVWEERLVGKLLGNGLFLTEDGFKQLIAEEVLAAPQPLAPEKCCVLNDGTVWTIADGGMAVWASIGSVETNFSEADIQMLRYQVAGQTGGGSASAASINSNAASMGGIFRIYESVSSRPDPFSEFPLASRDLRRDLSDLTIEELHIVGITLDPSGGDQAMVEDANGVAYILFEGTQLQNNTHIAEITSNEVIVVQEVTVGTDEENGGSTTIPTIFSMRLHEEGGL